MTRPRRTFDDEEWKIITCAAIWLTMITSLPPAVDLWDVEDFTNIQQNAEGEDLKDKFSNATQDEHCLPWQYVRS